MASDSLNTSDFTAQYDGNPYKDLYIYYLGGRLNTGGTDLGDDFIGNWEEEGCSFLFFFRPSHHTVESLLRNQHHLTLLDRYYMTYDQWQGTTPSAVRSGGFLITPPWEKKMTSGASRDIPIILDAGVVFGAGSHTTTKDCLEAVEAAFLEEEIESVLDLGTGTGVLAIAAACLGCKKSLAVDINRLAATTAEKNVKLNGFEDRILVAQGRAEDVIDYPADLLIANIHYEVIKNLMKKEAFLRHKFFILSGLMRSQAREVLYQLSKLPAGIIRKWDHDGIWHTIFGKNC